MFGVGEDFALSGVFFTPLPLLLQIFRKLVGVLHARNVAARARIAVPVPGAANAGTRFDDSRLQSLLAKLVQHVNARKAGPNNDRIDRLC